MIERIDRFNKWFDRQEEPKRFLLFMTYMAAAILPLQIGLRYDNVILTVFGFVLFSIACLVAVFRAFNLGGKHSRVGVIIGYTMLGLFAMISLAIAL
jgi:hypothetical protein